MSLRDFEFLIRVDDPGQAGLAADVAWALLQQAGYPAPDCEQIAASVRLEIGSASAAATCHVQFRAHAGGLDVTVSAHGRPDWQTTRPLP